MAAPQTIDDLAFNPRNPRKMSDKARAGLHASLDRFGDLSGITFNSRSGKLVCGHQRLSELRKMGGEYRDGSVWVGSREFPVRIVDWDEQTEREANVAANNRFIQGDWDDGAADFIAEIRAGMSGDEFRELRFEELADTMKSEKSSSEVIEWDASSMEIECRFSFSGPVELQAKVRKVLIDSFPGVEWIEDLVYG